MREYAAALEARGELRIVEREVDPRFEVAAVTQRAQRESDRPCSGRLAIDATVPFGRRAEFEQADPRRRPGGSPGLSHVSRERGRRR